MFLPSIKQLQYLIALHQHNHFGRAADACFVTQSTLSAGLRELETGLTEREQATARALPPQTARDVGSGLVQAP